MASDKNRIVIKKEELPKGSSAVFHALYNRGSFRAFRFTGRRQKRRKNPKNNPIEGEQ